MQKAEEKQIVMSIAVAALAAVFVLFQYLPLERKAKILKAANAKLMADNTTSCVRTEVLPAMLEKIEQVKKEVGDFNAKIPAGRSHGLFLSDLTSVMQKHGLNELVVQPGTEIETANLCQIPISINCKGKLEQIFEFFKALEKFERVIQIEEVTLAASEEKSGTVTMQAKINIFYRTAAGPDSINRTN